MLPKATVEVSLAFPSSPERKLLQRHRRQAVLKMFKRVGTVCSCELDTVFVDRFFVRCGVADFSQASLPRRLEEFMEQSVGGLKTSLRKVVSSEIEMACIAWSGVIPSGV